MDKKKLPSLVLVSMLCVSPALAQTIDAQLSASNATLLEKSPTSSVDGQNGKIKLNPSNRFNTDPSQIASQLLAGRSFSYLNGTKTPHKVKAAEKIAAAESYADSLVVYGIFSQQPGEQLSTKNMVQYSFQSAPVANFKTEASEATFPSGFCYARVNDNYFVFNVGRVTVVNANTGEIVKDNIGFSLDGEDITPMQAATYDPATKKIYVVYWGKNYGKSLLSFDPSTYEVNYLTDISGYTMSIAAAPDGKLYFINYPAKLNSYDPATKEIKELFSNVKAGADYQNASASQSGAFDWATGDLYLANLTRDWNTHLTKINVKTGKATDVLTFPERQRFVGLFIPYTDANAPSAPKNIRYADGKLQFTAPTQTYSSAENLTGTLTAYVTVEGGGTFEKSVKPGESVEMDLNLTDGKYFINVEIGNSAGRSTARRLATYVGTDVPSAVSNLEFVTEDGKNATISWQAPTQSIHGGPVDDASINYRVVRYPDEVVIADGIKDTSVKDVLPDTHARYYYEVTSFSGDRVGEKAVSKIIPAGDTWVPPYTEGFDTQDDYDFFKVIDANQDGKTWIYMLPQGTNTNGRAYLVGNGTADVDTGIYEGHGNDDYLISPKISLKAGVDYRLQFDNCDGWSNEHMTILLGKKDVVTGDETVINALSVNPNTHYSMIFNVAEDGLYYLMLHADNPGQSVSIDLDNLGIDVYSTYNGPASVTELKAEAGEKGALTNTLSFTAPDKTYMGGTLSAISKINVYRNGSVKPVHVFNTPSPGEQLSWTDNEVEQGSVTYRVVPFLEEEQGCEALVTNWVGLDMPAKVGNLKVRMDENNHAVATWEKVGDKGLHGGYVNPDEVTYRLCRYNERSLETPWETVGDSTSGLTLSDEEYKVEEGTQVYVDYMVFADNAAGTSEGVGAGIVLGTPYDRPYEESFPNGKAAKSPWTLYANSVNYAWQMVTGSGLAVKPYDKDEGMLQFSFRDSDSNNQNLSGPRIDLSNSTAPELSFYVYHGFEAEEGDLQLYVWLNYDDEGWNKVSTVEYNNGQNGWARFSLPLRNDADNVQIGFSGYAVDASAAIYIDQLKVDESVANDMAIEGISIDSKRVEAGESTKVKVNVANYGTKTAESYKVVLTRNGEPFAEKSGEAIAQNHSAYVTFDITTTKAEASSSYTYQAIVENDGDTYLANDSSSVVKLFVHGSVLPKAENLTGKTSGNTVTLTWQQPAKDEIADAVTDGFDEYESFIIDGIGDWKTYDGDGASTTYFNGPSIPNAYEPKAWQVWDPEEAGFSIEKFSVLTPHSGKKYLTCWAASNGVDATLPNDDWLISSEVTGGTDVSFYYRKPNDGGDPQEFEVLYSTTDNEPENFTVLDGDAISSSTDWQYFEYTLPAEAKYFAVRSCCTGSYNVAFLDDITYIPLYGTNSKVTLLGYNVYRDNELIAEKVPTTSYTDNTANGAVHNYYVTAVWKEGESNTSNAYLSDFVDGIDEVAVANDVKVVTSKGSIRVIGAEGKSVEVNTVSGQCVFQGDANNLVNVRIATGVYLVKVGKVIFKVSVK